MSKTDTNIEGQKAKIHKLALCSVLIAALGYWFWGLLSIISITAAITAIIQIKRSQGRLKGVGYALTGIIISVIWIIVILGNIFSVSPDEEFQFQMQSMCGRNLYILGEALFKYAEENNGNWPEETNWCDVVEGMGVSPFDFRCMLDNQGPCSYAMNPNCEPNSPNDVVFLFETKGGWNQFGGPELLSLENHKGEGCSILFNDGSVKFIKPEQLKKLVWVLPIDEQEPNSTQSQEKLPITYEEAVNYLLYNLSSGDKELIKATKKDDLIKFHFNWGMGIRNDLGLWGKNKELLESCAKKKHLEQIHPDDASMILIEGVWESLQQENIGD